MSIERCPLNEERGTMNDERGFPVRAFISIAYEYLPAGWNSVRSSTAGFIAFSMDMNALTGKPGAFQPVVRRHCEERSNRRNGKPEAIRARFGDFFVPRNDGAHPDCFGFPLLGVASRYVVLKARLLPCANPAYNCFVRMVSHAMHDAWLRRKAGAFLNDE
jgi:hypothetical protein